jgi:hypothetical protein
LLALLSFLSVHVALWDLVILSAATAMSYFALVYYAIMQLPKFFARSPKKTEAAVNRMEGGR